jgi:hypothetical protein
MTAASASTTIRPPTSPSTGVRLLPPLAASIAAPAGVSAASGGCSHRGGLIVVGAGFGSVAAGCVSGLSSLGGGAALSPEDASPPLASPPAGAGNGAASSLATGPFAVGTVSTYCATPDAGGTVGGGAEGAGAATASARSPTRPLTCDRARRVAKLERLDMFGG